MHIDELSSADAYIGIPGRGALTVKSLSGTCVLAAGQPGLGGGPLTFHVSGGGPGTVLAVTQGQPLTCVLPETGSGEGAMGKGVPHLLLHKSCVSGLLRGMHDDGTASLDCPKGPAADLRVVGAAGDQEPVLVLSRPLGAPSLGDVLAGQGAEGGGSLEQWDLYSNADGQWEQLSGSRGAEVFAQVRQQLAALATSACCDWLHSSAGIGGKQAAVEQVETASRLMLLDAGGGAVAVRTQSWQDMIKDKMVTSKGV